MNKLKSSRFSIRNVIAVPGGILIGLMLWGLAHFDCAPSESVQPQQIQTIIPQLHSVEWLESDFRGLLHEIAVKRLSADTIPLVQETSP